jgi:hypothetical protein
MANGLVELLHNPRFVALKGPQDIGQNETNIELAEHLAHDFLFLIIFWHKRRKWACPQTILKPNPLDVPAASAIGFE